MGACASRLKCAHMPKILSAEEVAMTTDCPTLMARPAADQPPLFARPAGATEVKIESRKEPLVEASEPKPEAAVIDAAPEVDSSSSVEPSQAQDNEETKKEEEQSQTTKQAESEDDANADIKTEVVPLD